MKSAVFFHIATIGRYQEIVNEILISIKDSGLLNDLDKIHLSVVGNGEIKLPYEDKIEFVFRSDNLLLFEFPTLEKLREFCKSNEDYIVLYLHTKGTGGVVKPIEDWRKYMTYFNVYKYKNAFEKLKEYDTYGVDLRRDYSLHYSGNFWWARSDYVRTLPEFFQMPTVLGERHKAEFWVCYNNKNHYSAWDCGIGVHARHIFEYPISKYKRN